MNQRMDAVFATGRADLGIQYCPSRIQALAAPAPTPEEEQQESTRHFEALLTLAAAANELESLEVAGGETGTPGGLGGESRLSVYGTCMLTNIVSNWPSKFVYSSLKM